MIKTIMQTAYYPPQFGDAIYSRETTLAKLMENKSKKMILVRAGAGFGKTVLLAAFYKRLETEKLWFSIPEVYFTLDKLLAYTFYGTLLKLSKEDQKKWEPVWEQMEMGFLPTDQVVTYLLNLFEEVAEELYLLIDDFQFLQMKEEEREQKILQMLLRFAPKNIHFVIASRESLPIPLNRFRLEKQVLVLEREDLTFKPDDIRTLLKQQNFVINDHQISWLYKKTEGWIAGISLILYWLQEAKSKEIDTILPLENYLTEILSGVQPEIKEFLSKTSLLFDVISTDICNEYLGIDNSEQILDRLTESHLLTQRYSEDGYVFYRYHNLLKEFFSQRLSDEEKTRYHLQLAELYRKQSLVQLEIAHLISANHDQKAIELLKKESDRILNSADVNLLMEWLDSLNIENIDPIIVTYRGLIREIKGRLDEALVYYDIAEKLAEETGEIIDWVKSRVQIAGIYWRQDDYNKCLQICKDTLPKVPESERKSLAGLYNLLGLSSVGLNNRAEGITYYIKARELCQQIGDRNGESWILNNLAFQGYFPEGEITKAIEAYRQALKNFKEIGNKQGMALVFSNLSFIYILMCEYDKAVPLLQEAEEIYIEQTNEYFLRSIWILRARLEVGRGNLDKATNLLEKVGEVLAGEKKPHYFVQYSLARSLLYYRQGKLKLASEWLDKADKHASELGEETYSYEELRLHRVVLGLGSDQLEQAAQLAWDILDKAQNKGLGLVKLEASLLLAAALRKQDKIVPMEVSSNLTILDGEGAFLKKRYHHLIANISKEVTSSNKTAQIVIDNHNAPTQIYFFGDFKILFNGRQNTSNDWTNKKALDILKYLMVHHDQWVRQDELLDTFWPDSDLKRSKQTLYVALYTIRRQWEPDLEKSTDSKFLKTRRGMCKFELPQPYWFDTETFHDFAAEGLRLYQERRLQKAEEFLREAKRIYVDDFLMENVYDEWTQSLRENFLKVYMEVLAALANIESSNKRYGAAVELLCQSLEKNPFQDEVHEQLMRYLLELGKVNQVIQHYHEYNELYLEELGLEMPGEILEIYQTARS